MTELEEKVVSLTSQLNEFKNKLSLSSSLNQRLEKQLQESKANNASLASLLNEASNKLSKVEEKNKLLSGDHDAFSNISLDQCDELILKWNRNSEILLQKRVSNESYL